MRPDTHKCHKFQLRNGKTYSQCLPRAWGDRAGIQFCDFDSFIYKKFVVEAVLARAKPQSIESTTTVQAADTNEATTQQAPAQQEEASTFDNDDSVEEEEEETESDYHEEPAEEEMDAVALNEEDDAETLIYYVE